jgi:hypothetical protein
MRTLVAASGLPRRHLCAMGIGTEGCGGGCKKLFYSRFPSGISVVLCHMTVVRVLGAFSMLNEKDLERSSCRSALNRALVE